VRNDFAVDFYGFAELVVVAVLGGRMYDCAHNLEVELSSFDNMMHLGACAAKMVDVVDTT
jgi:hypothetical protein